MISKKDLQYYSSLLIKKFRIKENKFLVEGLKIVEEGLNSNLHCEVVFVTPAFYESFPNLVEKISDKAEKIIQLKSIEFQKISDTKSPQGIAAVFKNKTAKFDLQTCKENLLVFIDNISDPGNLGTILRTCDWFGIENILLSEQTVEYLNPKVIRSSMGSIFHLNILDNVKATDLEQMKKAGYLIVCSDLRGQSIYSFSFPEKFIISFSNESLGPSEDIKNISDSFLTIPRIGKAESLNVSSAAAIILSNFRK